MVEPKESAFLKQSLPSQLKVSELDSVLAANQEDDMHVSEEGFIYVIHQESDWAFHLDGIFETERTDSVRPAIESFQQFSKFQLEEV